jgi:predicted TIM-barrel fold metal-dependent hydrolase
VRTTDLAPKDAVAAIEHLRATVSEAHAVGDLEALAKRLDALVAVVDSRREERRAAKAKQNEEAKTAKEQLVTEAEQLAESEQWRTAGERLHLEGPAPAGPQGRRRAVAPLQPRPFGVLQAPQGALRVA